MSGSHWLRAVVCVVVAMIPGIAPGEVVRLKDESTFRGKLVRVDGDTLTFKTAFGALKFHRSQVISVVFDDSAAAALPAVAVPARPGDTVGRGRIEVVFEDRDLSSKIAIELKRQWDEHIASNYIVVELLVDGHVAHSETDTTMDKKIYKGHTTVFKNDIELKDFWADVPAGLHHAKIVVRNADAMTFRNDFDPEPLDLVVAFDNLDIRAGEIVRLDVGIKRGKLHTGRPKLYRVQ